VLNFDGDSGKPYVHCMGKGETNSYEWAFRFYSRISECLNHISAYIFNLEGGLDAGAYFQDALIPG
jgi:hypothetical protein